MHTPGPWKVSQINDETYVDVGYPTGQLVAQIDPLHAWPEEYREPFARLIAAAPEMLAFIRARLLDAACRSDECFTDNFCDPCEARARFARIGG